MPQDLPAENAVWRFFARMPADRDILTQEALFFLLATISSTHDTCSEITTRPMTMTLPSRHPSCPATQGNLSVVTVLNLLQKCVVHFCSQFNIVTGASAPPLPSSSCAFADRAPPSSRNWPNGVPCPLEAPRSLCLASRQRYPRPLLRPLRHVGPVPTTTAQAVPRSQRAVPLMSGRSSTNALPPVASPTSTAHNGTWTPTLIPIRNRNLAR